MASDSSGLGWVWQGVAQMVEACLMCTEPWMQSLALCDPGVVVRACNSCTPKVALSYIVGLGQAWLLKTLSEKGGGY